MTNPNDALEAFNRILRLTAYSDVSRGIDDEDIDLIRAALAQKPPVEGLAEALGATSILADIECAAFIKVRRHHFKALRDAARAYQQGHTAAPPPPQESVDWETLRVINWTREMSDAWHKAIPDTRKAFDDLIAAATHNITKKG